MEPNQSRWRWQEGIVDVHKEHVEIDYGDAGRCAHDEWEPIARIGKPEVHVFIVEWLITPDSPEYQSKIAGAQGELDFYLMNKGEPDPWAYALYHCNTASNMYSAFHWSYFPGGPESVRESSEVIRVSAETGQEMPITSRGRSIRGIKLKG